MDPAPSLLERMVAAGLSEDRARSWITAGAVRVAGRVVTDPGVRVPAGTRWMIRP